MVDKLNYLGVTRMDVALEVSAMSWFMSSPRVPHQHVVLWTLKYLKRKHCLCVWYHDNEDTRFEGFSDAD
uniref:Uncharacterized protein n=1 Tax=Rhizophora mucronata TaxID=61149 RepID=A0A2P2N2T8_RHIMU